MKTTDRDCMLLHDGVCNGRKDDNDTMNSADGVLGLGCSMCKDLDLTLTTTHTHNKKKCPPQTSKQEKSAPFRVGIWLLN